MQKVHLAADKNECINMNVTPGNSYTLFASHYCYAVIDSTRCCRRLTIIAIWPWEEWHLNSVVLRLKDACVQRGNKSRQRLLRLILFRFLLLQESRPLSSFIHTCVYRNACECECCMCLFRKRFPRYVAEWCSVADVIVWVLAKCVLGEFWEHVYTRRVAEEIWIAGR